MSVKTAISIPDAIFERAQQHAARLGMSRSEFFSRAADSYARSLEEADVTQAIDAALDAVGEEANDTEFVHAAASRLRLDDAE